MHRLSAPSAPLVVFLAAMVGGSSVLHLGIIVLGVCLLCVLASGVHFIPWRSFALAGVSLSFIVLGFEMTVAQQSQNVAKDVAKCSSECFIELQVSWWQYNKADCKAVEFSQYRQGCTTAIRLPPSQVWLPGTRYRIHGRLFIPSDSTKQVARLKAHARAELGLRPEWGVFLVDKREALRTFVRDRLSPDAQGIVWALISGRRELIASSERDRWSRAGLIHYVAISGLHVGIVLGVWLRGCQGLLGMLSLLGRKQRVLMFTLNIGSVLLLMGLLVWWGTPSSALRSAGMWAVALVARTFRLRYRGSDALGTSGLLLILADPLLSRDLGFQLSSFAVVGLLWAGANDRSTFLAKASSLRTSLSATLMSTPLIAEGFGIASLVGGTLSILVLPVVTYWIAPGIVLLILLWCLEQSTAEPVVSFIELGVAIINAFADVLAPFAQSISWTGWMFMVLGCMLLAVRWSSVLACLILLVTVYGGLGSLTDEPVARLRIDALDVGQGDATLIRTPDGQSILFDTGGQPGGEWGEDGFYDAIVELRRLGISRIDMIIVSHPDPDHTGALEAILRSFEVGRLLVDHYASDDLRLKRTISAWCSEKIACQLSLPEYLAWRSGETRFEIYGLGSIHGQYLSDNERSLSLRVSQGHQSALLTGDLPRWAELSLLRRIDGPVGLLKLGHHGSRTSSDRWFLETLAPQLAWSSHGQLNRFGHPHADVLERLEALDIPLDSTAEQGTLTYELIASGWVRR